MFCGHLRIMNFKKSLGCVSITVYAPFTLLRRCCIVVHVYLFQNHFFLHQLTHNMTKDCSECQNKNEKQFVHTTCTEQFSCTELISQWTLCCHIVGYLADPRISASDKNLPETTHFIMRRCKIVQRN